MLIFGLLYVHFHLVPGLMQHMCQCVSVLDLKTDSKVEVASFIAAWAL